MAVTINKPVSVSVSPMNPILYRMRVSFKSSAGSGKRVVDIYDYDVGQVVTKAAKGVRAQLTKYGDYYGLLTELNSWIPKDPIDVWAGMMVLENQDPAVFYFRMHAIHVGETESTLGLVGLTEPKRDVKVTNKETGEVIEIVEGVRLLDLPGVVHMLMRQVPLKINTTVDELDIIIEGGGESYAFQV